MSNYKVKWNKIFDHLFTVYDLFGKDNLNNNFAVIGRYCVDQKQKLFYGYMNDKLYIANPNASNCVKYLEYKANLKEKTGNVENNCINSN